MVLVQNVPASRGQNRVRTPRGEVYEAGEGDDPKALGADNVATIELEGESTSATWASDRSIREITNQKPIG